MEKLYSVNYESIVTRFYLNRYVQIKKEKYDKVNFFGENLIEQLICSKVVMCEV